MGYEQELRYLRNRVKDLEKQVEHLRISRRVLMNLVEKIEYERKEDRRHLEKENKRLQISNQRYANCLMKYNCRFVELQSAINEVSVSETQKHILEEF